MRQRSLAIALLLTLVGCKRGIGDPNSVRYSNWGGASEGGAYDLAVEKLHRDFERESGLHIQQEGLPDNYVQKMVLSFVAGSAPDVMSVDASSAAIFINNGLLRDLTPLLKQDPDFQLDDYWTTTLNVYKRDQKLYAIPGDFTPIVLYYNKKLFREAGVEVPTHPWTYEEFLAASKKLTKPGQYGFLFSDWMPGWVMWLWNNGGEVLDGEKASQTLDSPKNAEAVAFLRDLVTKHKVSPSLSQLSSMGTDLFASGKAAMQVTGHWVIPSLKTATGIKIEDVGVMPLPTNTGTSQTVLYEVGFAIPNQCKDPEKAWKLIRHLTGKKFQTTYQQTGIAVCARQDVASAKATDSLERTFLSIVPSGRPPTGSQVIGYEYVEAEGKKMIERVLSGTDPKAALTEMATRIDGYFGMR